MASASRTTGKKKIDYPTSDGRPMAETDIHRKNMTDLIGTLDAHYADDPNVYVSGNIFVYYFPGDRLKHLSPDVLVVKGVPRRLRDYYLVWEEGKVPDVVIELTSLSTRGEDIDDKFMLYRDVLRIPEYFLFDPHGEYLKPSLQGYRLRGGRYVPIRPVGRRLPSKVLGLHLERRGQELRLFDPVPRRYLLTPQEASVKAEAAAQQAVEQAEALAQQAKVAVQQAEAALLRSEAENERLRSALEALRHLSGSS